MPWQRLATTPDLGVAKFKNDMVTSWPNLTEPTEFEVNDGSISFRVGSTDVVLGKIPVPIPWSDLEGPCKNKYFVA